MVKKATKKDPSIAVKSTAVANTGPSPTPMVGGHTITSTSTGGFSTSGSPAYIQGTNANITISAAGGSWAYTDPVSELRAEVDQMREALDAAVANYEKMEIEARYWHIKSEALEKTLERLLDLKSLD